jgi:DNA-binding response OmpR family regulator
MSGILVIGDERALRETLAYNLRRSGFQVRTAGDGAAGRAAARAEPPHRNLLDVLLPGGMDGFELCRLLRHDLRCPIVLISALSEEVDRVVGLEVGADDYVVKPFSTVELLARIKAHLRRAAFASSNESTALPSAGPPLVVGPISIDLSQRRVVLEGRVIELTRREYDLLCHLARHPGITLTRLLDAVWPEEINRSDTRTVDVHVYRLRERIEPDPANPRFIHTVRGLGYALRVTPRSYVNVPLKSA